MEEIWKEIEGFEKYLISNLGRIKTKKFGRFRKIQTNERGYNRIVLSKKNKSYNFYIHRLVAETFINKESPEKVVIHKDNDKSNNAVTNLMWTDRKREIK